MGGGGTSANAVLKLFSKSVIDRFLMNTFFPLVQFLTNIDGHAVCLIASDENSVLFVFLFLYCLYQGRQKNQKKTNFVISLSNKKQNEKSATD